MSSPGLPVGVAQAFLRGSSGLEGAEPHADSASMGGLNPAVFLSGLSSILGTSQGGGVGGGDSSSDESSDFYDDGNGDSSDAMSEGRPAPEKLPSGEAA